MSGRSRRFTARARNPGWTACALLLAAAPVGVRGQPLYPHEYAHLQAPSRSERLLCLHAPRETNASGALGTSRARSCGEQPYPLRWNDTPWDEADPDDPLSGRNRWDARVFIWW